MAVTPFVGTLQDIPQINSEQLHVYGTQIIFHFWTYGVHYILQMANRVGNIVVIGNPIQ